jgi:hypothetical protein
MTTWEHLADANIQMQRMSISEWVLQGPDIGLQNNLHQNYLPDGYN